MLERTFTKRCFAISSFVLLNFLSLTPLEGRLRRHHDHDERHTPSHSAFVSIISPSSLSIIIVVIILITMNIRILNRLSCDMFVIDQKLPSCLQVTLNIAIESCELFDAFSTNWRALTIVNPPPNRLNDNPQRLLLVTLICLSSLAVNCIQVSLVFFTSVFNIFVFENAATS